MEKKPEVKLIGSDGNVFSIIGNAERAIKKFNKENPKEVINVTEFVNEAMSGDYDHAIQTVMKYCNVS